MIIYDNICCPICGTKLINFTGNVQCENKHCFDIAKSGYINFCCKRMGKLYDQKELFISRRKIYEAGFWTELEKVIMEFVRNKIERGIVLDVGCGEGSIISHLETKTNNYYIGLDISKEAIKLASKTNKNVCWLVSDLCKLPIAERSIDCIINMLSPANYEEFNRVLRKGGYIIKIIPNGKYLYELRQALGISEYKDKGTLDYFQKKYKCEHVKRINYEFYCNDIESNNFFMMTPLSNKLSITDYNFKLEKLTVDLIVLFGIKA